MANSLEQRLSVASLIALARLYPEIRFVPDRYIEAACAEMRRKAKPIIEKFACEKTAPKLIVEMAFQLAALTLAEEGLRVLQRYEAAWTDTQAVHSSYH